MFPGTQGLYSLEGIGGADALNLGPYEQLVDAAGIERPMGPLAEGGWLTTVSPDSLKRLSPLLDMLNVEFLLAPADGLSWGLAELPSRGVDRIKALRRPAAWPRAFFANVVTTYEKPRDLLDTIRIHPGPLAAVQSTDAEAVAATGGLHGSGAVVPARGYALTTNATRFTVSAPGPGVAVLAEAYLPGDFRATLNGRPVSYFRVNHAFKAVEIPAAGDWTVKFEYVPARLGLSIVLAVVGLALLAALAILSRVLQRAAGANPHNSLERTTVGSGR
jgi:hypothetical protein